MMGNPGIFLTGATGYIGSYVVDELVRRGIPITALVRREVQFPGCRTVVGDLADVERFAQEISAAGGIVHMGSSRSLDRGTVARIDINGTSRLIDHWRAGPFVYLSTTTIHGRPQGPLNEASPIAPSCWYDMGKYACEIALAEATVASKKGRGPAISLRPALIFSTNARRHDNQFIGSLFRHCAQGHVAVFDSEEALETYGASYIGGADFGRAVADTLAIKAPGPLTLADDFQTWKSWIETYHKYAGTRPNIVVRPGIEAGPGEWRPLHSRTALDSSAFTKRTSFKPRQSFEELVREFVERDRADGLL
ncbi:MAG TPA: NAD(P)-dependent oxidoreductase [Ktedonobacterales bacterium]